MTPDAIPWLFGAVLLVLIGLSAFFSISETALIRAERIKIRHRAEQGDRLARAVDHTMRHPERILGTILVGNNLVNIAAATLATYIAVQLWGARGAAYAAIALTVVILVFAEITPKTLAVKKPLTVARIVILPLRAADVLLRPLAWLLTAFANILLRPLGLRPSTVTPFITQEEIEMLVRVGAQEGEVEPFEHRVIEEVFDFTETAVRRVVTPWDRVHYLPKEARLRDALDLVGRSGHSRIPIVDGDFEHVLGFVHAKDLLKHTDGELQKLPVTSELRGVLFCPGSARADEVLARMQRERRLMAIVQDREGRNVGIATVEDLLEELVGEIHDEFDMQQKGPAPAD